ncbi:cyclic GMP-AMP synthase-like receptor isoform X1 [Cydia pomonella]|uniref:cyclic GMP-AMP synthase-like receptor isoform X1 n=2 Tax=Cydia pomonella TaxID=82600 RepID=UPI002ADDB545|nr:cyclic GMP-AMP synthase-like receptor isoform X1 [Cydia pomonella]XP_061728300.1 cyclic GMP-AMP synthase-like receptor isoform X1 [Cydia pomonella]
MSQNRNRTNGNSSDDDESLSSWEVAGLVGLAGLAIGAGAYYLTSSSSTQAEEQKKKEERERAEARQRELARQEAENQGGYSAWNLFTNVVCAVGSAVMGSQLSAALPAEPVLVVPEKPVITNMNGLLHDIYVRYIALKDKEFEVHYNVFMNIFHRLHEQMKVADKYYNRYSSTVQFAGSHYDRLRINKPDEFDMDIIIGLPVNLKEAPNPANSDIVLEPKAPGFIQLKAGTQFQNLPKRDGADWVINRTAHDWLDERNYLLRSKFTDWFKSVVNKAMNSFPVHPSFPGRRVMNVDGIAYTLRLSSSGPAITLIIENSRGFRLDVDLVPALKFPEERWPICRPYRKVPDKCHHEIFMVVPKPMKGGLNRYDTDRSWRIAMHLQERDIMHASENMRQAIRLIKKLRDSQGLNKIASYYIKTIFYHEAMARQSDPHFWRRSPADLFNIMVKKFIEHLESGEIAYFWNKENNLIGHIERSTLTGYANKLKKLVPILDDPSKYKWAAKYLLTDSQFKEYNDKFLHI